MFQYEGSVAVRDRVAFACMFLNDAQVNQHHPQNSKLCPFTDHFIWNLVVEVEFGIFSFDLITGFSPGPCRTAAAPIHRQTDQ